MAINICPSVRDLPLQEYSIFHILSHLILLCFCSVFITQTEPTSNKGEVGKATHLSAESWHLILDIPKLARQHTVKHEKLSTCNPTRVQGMTTASNLACQVPKTFHTWAFAKGLTSIVCLSFSMYAAAVGAVQFPFSRKGIDCLGVIVSILK